ncbi:hypothetical protein GH714_038997 [Hevea brasiliensis]|uniref:Uncharacterized protein n=1 Tax=Hevea brasiliensis TaxID=3981 RepID=A0A6A6KR14_HEVBR|nr:hypothetical protein GH714_038997 [Hevea brasiliensis]
MGRAPCCDKANVKKGPWSPEEDAKLKDYIAKHGKGGNWIALPLKAARSVAEPIPFSNPLSSSNNNNFFTTTASILPPQDSSFLAAMQIYQMKDSCSSSDGSCNNQISHGKELEYEYGGGGGAASTTEQMGLQNYFYNGVEDGPKLLGVGGGWGEKQNGLWGVNPIIDYGLEEIKQLISTSNCSNNFLFEESKTAEERFMYY